MTDYSNNLAAKALAKLLEQHNNLYVFKVTRTSERRFKVTGEHYHDCDRAPSYTTTDTIMSGLNRMEAEQLKAMLEAQRAAIKAAQQRRNGS